MNEDQATELVNYAERIATALEGIQEALLHYAGEFESTVTMIESSLETIAKRFEVSSEDDGGASTP